MMFYVVCCLELETFALFCFCVRSNLNNVNLTLTLVVCCGATRGGYVLGFDSCCFHVLSEMSYFSLTKS